MYIGGGSTAQVVLVNGMARKIIDRDEYFDIYYWKKEIENVRYLQQFNFDFLPQFYEINEHDYYYDMEYIKGKELNTDFIEQEDSSYILNLVTTITNHCVKLIQNGIFPCDLHDGNILIENGKVIFIDIGYYNIMSSKVFFEMPLILSDIYYKLQSVGKEKLCIFIEKQIKEIKETFLKNKEIIVANSEKLCYT